MITPSQNTVVIASAASKTFQSVEGALPVLDAIDLDIRAGEILSIVGESGGGKSTLLNVIAGEIKVDSGIVRHLKVGLSTEPIGYLRQQSLALPFRTLFQNTALPVELASQLSHEKAAQLNDMLATVGLAGFNDYLPDQVSGGMLRRANFVGTLALDTRLLLLDEPFTAVDRTTLHTLEDLLWQHIKASGAGAVVVSHDLDSAIAISDRVVVLTPRPARVYHTLELSEFEDVSPASRRGTSASEDAALNLWKLLHEATRNA